MKWSTRLGRLLGIDIYVHWTFLLLIGWIAAVLAVEGDGLRTAIAGVTFILAVFACVVLHELGHATMARRFGIRTRDITLLPIGGLARLEHMPEKPDQELLVALAGPAVNVAIAGALFAGIGLLRGAAAADTFQWLGGSFFVNLMWINVMLAAFNLLPAFPMDGGRVLRAALALRMDYVRATDLAAAIGQGMAVMFGVLGVASMNLILVLIAFFVFIGAKQEAKMVYAHTLMRGATVGDAMQTHYRAFRHDEMLRAAMEEILSGNQQSFPVAMPDGGVGVLAQSELMEAVSEGREGATVGEVARRDWTPVEASAPLEATFERMAEDRIAMLPVLRQGELAGIVTLDGLSQWLSMRAALDAARERNKVENILRHV